MARAPGRTSRHQPPDATSMARAGRGVALRAAAPQAGVADPPGLHCDDRGSGCCALVPHRHALGRQAHHRRRRRRSVRHPGCLTAVAARRARDRHRLRWRDPRPRLGAGREPARRPVLEPHQRPADGARRDARSRAVRGSRLLRPARARAAADDGPHRAAHAAARDGAGRC